MSQSPSRSPAHPNQPPTARLAESESRSMLLLEAGPDRRRDTPEEIRDGWQITRDFDRGYVSESDPHGAVQEPVEKQAGRRNVVGDEARARDPRAVPRPARRGAARHQRCLRTDPRQALLAAARRGNVLDGPSPRLGRHRRCLGTHPRHRGAQRHRRTDHARRAIRVHTHPHDHHRRAIAASL
jgi:hypothetical protein